MGYNLRKRTRVTEEDENHSKRFRADEEIVPEEDSSDISLTEEDLEEGQFIDDTDAQAEGGLAALLGMCQKEYDWKDDVPEEDVEKYAPVYEELQESVKSRDTTLVQILDANLSEDDRILAYKYYVAMQKMSPESLDRIAIEKEIESIMKRSRGMTKERAAFITAEQKRYNSTSHNEPTLCEKIFLLNASDDTKKKIYEMYLSLQLLDESTQEYQTLHAKILWALSLPHNTSINPLGIEITSRQEISRICEEVRNGLDSKIYGLEEVKDKMLCVLNDRLTGTKSRSTIALKGVPGVAKTRIAEVMAKSMGLPFERVCLGGMKDASFLKGTQSSWVGATPSIVLQILKRMGCNNGVVLFDEIDKLGQEGKAVAHALLHITDYTSNSAFQDMYLREFNHDLSKLWFMFAMNDDSDLDSALKDRLDIITIEKPSHSSLVKISRDYVLPRCLSRVGLKKTDVVLTEEAVEYIIRCVDPSGRRKNGVRPIEKAIGGAVSKINMLITLGGKYPEYANCKGEISLPFTVDLNIAQRLVKKQEYDDAPQGMYM